jgi:hypothetical protein
MAGIEAEDQEAFVGAAETIRAFKFGTSPNVGLIPPYDELLRNDAPREDDIEALKCALVRYLSVEHRAHKASAAFALGAIGDSSLVPFLREQLSQQLSALMKHNATVGTLLCALNNHGESAITGSSYSVCDIEKNVGDARAYLGRFGVVVPW